MEALSPDMEQLRQHQITTELPQLQGATRHRHLQQPQLQLPLGLESPGSLHSTRTISPAMEEGKYARSQLLITPRRAHSPTEQVVTVHSPIDHAGTEHAGLGRVKLKFL